MDPETEFWSRLASSDCTVSQIAFYRVLDRRTSTLATAPGGKPEWALVCIVRGGYRYETPDGNFDCHPGDVLFLPLGSVYRHVTRELPTEAHVIYFRLRNPDGTNYPSDGRVRKLVPREPGRFHALFDEAETLYFSADPSQLLLKITMYRLFEAVRQETASRGAENGPAARIAPAMELLRTHAPAELTVAGLAQACGLNEYTFREYFKRVMGTTPKRYLEERMVEQTEQLLTASDVTVTDAALASGFSDPSYFFKMYRRIRGHTPKRKKNGSSPG